MRFLQLRDTGPQASFVGQGIQKRLVLALWQK
jgi:hypothetical protein